MSFSSDRSFGNGSVTTIRCKGDVPAQLGLLERVGLDPSTTKEDNGQRLMLYSPVMGAWRNLHNEELHNLYPSPNIIKLIESRRMRCAGHVKLMRGMTNASRVLIESSKGILLGKRSHTWHDNAFFVGYLTIRSVSRGIILRCRPILNKQALRIGTKFT
jgi:hypothetical protein